MDFLHPTRKRKQKIQLLLGYVLMTIALTIATIVAVFFTLGFDVDPKTGDIIRRGLVIVDAHPESANVLIDGEVRGVSKLRLVLAEGAHSVELQRDGYRSWSHKIDLVGGEIEQLAYPFLFPSELVSSKVRIYDQVPGLITQSPDRRWLLIQNQDSLDEFELFDLNEETPAQSSVTLPDGTLSPGSGNHSLRPVEWASDNRHVLVRHTWEDGHEFVVINVDEPLESVNISKLFANQPATSIALRDKKPDKFYLYNSDTKTVVFGDGANGAVKALLKNVTQFHSYKDDTLLYVSAKDEETVNVHFWKDGTSRLLRSLPAAKRYFLEAAEFDGQFYIVSGSQADGRVYIYRDPLDELTDEKLRLPSPYRVLVVPDARYVSFSTNTRFITAQAGAEFATYDAETDRQYRYNIGLPVASEQQAWWMDGHRQTVAVGGKVYAVDFDGENKQELVVMDESRRPYFSQDYEAMFTFSTDEKDQFTLSRTTLIVD